MMIILNEHIFIAALIIEFKISQMPGRKERVVALVHNRLALFHPPARPGLTSRTYLTSTLTFHPLIFTNKNYSNQLPMRYDQMTSLLHQLAISWS